MIKKVLFPAAGYGTRFLPATKAMPKEMIPVLNKPLIQYGVEEAMNAKIFDIAIVTGRGKRAIEDHFDISYELEHQLQGTSKEILLRSIREIIYKCKFSYTRQIEMLGLGHAVLTGQSLIGNEPFAVVLCDDLCVKNEKSHEPLSEMVRLYEKYKCSIVMVMEVDKNETHKYGVIAGDKIEEGIIKVDNMIEKPRPQDAPSNLAIVGRYILTPDIFEILENTKPGKGGEIQLTDALLEQAKNGNVIAYCYRGKRFDCGNMHGFVEATKYLYDELEK